MTTPTATLFVPYHALDDVILRGTLAARPAAADVVPGTLYFASDAIDLERSTGTVWEPYSVVYNQGTWTPALTFATPGDLAVTYAVQAGGYIQIGVLVYAYFNLQTATFTHTTASGNLLVTGLPFPSITTATAVFLEPIVMQGVSKPNYSNFTARILPNVSQIDVRASGQGQTIVSVTAADVPSGASVVLQSSPFYLKA